MVADNTCSRRRAKSARDRVVGEATRKQSGGTGTVRMRPKLGQKETLQMHIEKIQRDNPELPTPTQS